MSAFKKIVGLAAGVSAVGVIGVAVAQGVPPNPYISNPAIGAGEQTVHMTPIGETGVLAEAPVVVDQTAMLTKENQSAAVASETQPQQPEPVAQAPQQDTNVAQAAPAPSDNTNTLGAGPSNDTNDTNDQPVHAPKHDRG